MCYSLLECLLENLLLQLAALNDNVGQSCFKDILKLVLLGVHHFRDRPRTQSAHHSCVTATSFSSQHSPLADFKEQPNCSVQQGLNPLLKMGHQGTYETPLTPRTTWCSENSGFGRIDIFLFKKGNKDSGCRGRVHLHSIRYACQGGRQPLPGPPPPSWAVFPPTH